MLNLILKDFAIQKKNLLFCFGYCFFILIIYGRDPIFNHTVYIMVSLVVSYMLLLGASTVDAKNNSEIILNSLPLKRSQIVLAKYLTLPVYVTIALLFTLFSSVVLRSFGMISNLGPLTAVDILASLFGVGLLGSVYLPLFLEFGNRVLILINIIIFMLAFFLPGFLIGYVRSHSTTGAVYAILTLLQTAPAWVIAVSVLLLTLLIVLVSMAISLRLYQHKDLD